MIFIAGCQHIGVKARSHENDESRGPVHVSSLWQRGKKMDMVPKREIEKRDLVNKDCLMKIMDSWSSTARSSFGNLKRRKEKDC
jgi:hypothetical protein